MLPHQNRSSSQPPAIGPRATATPVVAPQMPMALARWTRSGKTFATIDRVTGKMTAAPIPATARHAVSSAGDSLPAPASEAAANTASPPSRKRRRPKRSLRLPAASTRAAKARLKASTIHSRSRVEAPSSPTSVGRATLTIVVDTLMTKTARHSTASTAQRRRAGGEADGMVEKIHQMWLR